LELSEFLARQDVPNTSGLVSGLVGALREKGSAVRREVERSDELVIALECCQYLAGLGIPDLDRLAARRGNAFAVRREGGMRNASGVREVQQFQMAEVLQPAPPPVAQFAGATRQQFLDVAKLPPFHPGRGQGDPRDVGFVLGPGPGVVRLRPRLFGP